MCYKLLVMIARKKERHTKKESYAVKIVRILFSITIVSASILYFLYELRKRMDETKKSKEVLFVDSVLVTNDDVFAENFFYRVGDGKFNIDSENKVISVMPAVSQDPLGDDFVSLTSRIPFVKSDQDQDKPLAEIDKLILSFEYKYEKAGVNKKFKTVGAAVLLVSKMGAKSTYLSYPECSAGSSVGSSWKKCELTMSKIGKPVLMVLRFGATNYYSKAQFRNIKIRYRARKEK